MVAASSMAERGEFALRLTSRGVVAVEAGPEEGTGWAAGVASRFAEEEAAGLVALAAAKLPAHASGSVRFWRDAAAEFLRALCHVTEDGSFRTEQVAPPARAGSGVGVFHACICAASW